MLYAIYGDFVSYYPLTLRQPEYVNIFGFAVTYPEMSFYVYFVPIKGKIFGIYITIEVYSFIMGGVITKVSIGPSISLCNILFTYKKLV